MNEPTKTNVVDYWLEMEAAAAPESPVVAALKAATKSMKLDEGAVLRKLRELYAPSPDQPSEAHVSNQED